MDKAITEVVNELTKKLVDADNRNKVLRAELTDAWVENRSLNHMVEALNTRLNCCGRDIAHYKHLLEKNGISCIDEMKLEKER